MKKLTMIILCLAGSSVFAGSGSGFPPHVMPAQGQKGGGPPHAPLSPLVYLSIALTL